MGLPGRFGFHSESGRFHQKRYKLTIGDKSVVGAIWLLPGMADNAVGVALGYGRGVGRVGGAAGFNAYQARTTGTQHVATGAKLEKLVIPTKLPAHRSRGSWTAARWCASATPTTEGTRIL